MSVALFIQTQNPTEGSDQTLLVPNHSSGKVDIYHRTSTGKRGRSEAWQTVASTDALPDTPLTHEPVAIRLSDSDMNAVTFGSVTSIAVKALNAFENAEPCSDAGTHSNSAEALRSRLTVGDSLLGDFLVDKRITNKTLALEPLVRKTQEQVIVDSRPLVSAVRTELASIPDAKWAQEYINRKVSGNLTDFDIYDIALANDQNVLIRGHAGSGKTMSVLAYASCRKMRYYNVSSHIGVEPSQLFGKFNPNPNYGLPNEPQFIWQDGAVTDLVRHGGVLLINEVNFLPERVTTVLFSLLDDRREIQLMDKDGETIKAHPDLLIVADMNPNYRGTRELNQAWNDRYAHHLEFPYDPAIEKKLIPNNAIRDMASKLRDSFDNEELVTPISTRSLVAFIKNIATAGLDYAIYSYVNTFPAREQAPVRLVIDTMRINIERDLGIAPAPVVDVPVTFDSTGNNAITNNVINNNNTITGGN